MTAGKLALIAMLLAAAPAAAQTRAGKSEFYVAPVFTDGKSYTFEGGSTATTDTGTGLVIGYAKNLNPHFAAGIEVEWGNQDYRASVQPGAGNTNAVGQYSSYIEQRTIRFYGTWNMLESNFTPFLTGGLGWTYIDSNIPAGLPENVCWSYPWYGAYCASYVPTQTTTKFSYNAGAGLRLDAGKGVFRLMANSQWYDFGGSYGSSNVIQYRIDFGYKF
jgi:Outer membrane protein beta-barrel domain